MKTIKGENKRDRFSSLNEIEKLHILNISRDKLKEGFMKSFREVHRENYFNTLEELKLYFLKKDYEISIKEKEQVILRKENGIEVKIGLDKSEPCFFISIHANFDSFNYKLMMHTKFKNEEYDICFQRTNKVESVNQQIELMTCMKDLKSLTYAAFNISTTENYNRCKCSSSLKEEEQVWHDSLKEAFKYVGL